jgi:predicted PurR-regulated permease PerM
MEIIGVLAAILGLLVLVGRVVYPIWIGTKTIVEWLEKFRRDWEGEDAEPGRDRVPGVMERLNKLDGELSHNGGSSLKDAVERIEKHLGTR